MGYSNADITATTYHHNNVNKEWWIIHKLDDIIMNKNKFLIYSNNWFAYRLITCVKKVYHWITQCVHCTINQLIKIDGYF